jgi:hypothetical protein
VSRINVYAEADPYSDEPAALLGWFDPTSAERFDQGKEWDGNNMIGTVSGSQWIDEYLYRTKGGRWVRNTDSTRHMGGPDEYRFITDEEAKDWMLRSGNADEEIERFFGELPEETGPGRPEVGGAVHVRLGETLAPVDEYAARIGLKRAAAVRRLVELGLKAVTLAPGMKPIVFECNVVTGTIAADTGDWSADDARWRFIESPDVPGMNDLGTSVEPWGEDECSMDRATQAVRDLGFTVGEWTEEADGSTWQAVVTGRA